MKNVLISGGSGLVGQKLTELLITKGYQVSHLSRRKKNKPNVKVYEWDLAKGFIEQEAIEQADYIVHLAGANIGEGRWTKARRKSIVDSRVKSGNLLYQTLKKQGKQLDGFISASAIGYYGDRGAERLTEESGTRSGFMEEVCQQWEIASKQVEELGIRTVLLRIGIVLDKNGGALPKTAMSLKANVGTYFGNGEQYYSWIHIEDLCRMFIHAIENKELKGVYNAVAPKPVNNKDFVKAIASALDKSALLIPAPAFALRLAMGEMANIVLYSANVASDKIANTNFEFQYPSIDKALKEIYSS